MKTITVETANSPSCTFTFPEPSDVMTWANELDDAATLFEALIDMAVSHDVNHVIRTKQRGKQPQAHYDMVEQLRNWTAAREGMPTKQDVETAKGILKTVRTRIAEGISLEELDQRVTRALGGSYPLWKGACELPAIMQDGKEVLAPEVEDYLAGLVREARLAKAPKVTGI